MMRFALTGLALLIVPTVAHADAPADATALFDQGLKDMEAGNIERACKAFAASLAKYPDSGTKGALAECYTTLGKVASAWTLWKELADTAPAEDLRADAAVNATKLEPRLPRYLIELAAATPGLVVTINGNRVADPTLAIALPVDPGPLAVSARAPGFKDWSATDLRAYEGRTTKIEIPQLAPAPRPVEPLVTGTVGSQVPTTVVVREDHAATRRSRHVIGGSMGVLGVVSLGVGGYFGLQTFKKWDQVKELCGGGDRLGSCQQFVQAESLSEQARSTALVSTILMSAGGAAVIVGGIIWLSAPKDERRTATGLRVTPSVSPDGVGVTFSGGWR
jgi:hypothetical protein